MPNWKKVITSGSDAVLNSLYVTGDITGSNFSSSGDIFTDTLTFGTGSDHTVGTGQFGWNTTDGIFNVGLEDGVVLQLGQEMHFRVKASGSINNGEVAMFVGAQGDHVIAGRATQAALNTNPEYFLGVATHNLSNNEFGYITTYGLVRELDTDTPNWDEGTILWFDSAGSTPGALTGSQPPSPYAQIRVAAVTRRNPGDGAILVRPDRLPRLKRLQDVSYDSIIEGDLLVYNSGSHYWENSRTLSGSYTINNGGLTADSFTGSFTGSFVGDGSGLTGIVSASYALTASYALNGGGGGTVENAISASYAVTASYVDFNFSGATLVTQSFTDTTSVEVVHNLGTKSLVVEVWDSEDNVIIPQNIVNTTTSSLDISFPTAESGYVVVAKAGHVAQYENGSVDYPKLADTIVGRATDNDGNWDFSNKGIYDAAISSNTVVTFSNLQKNKTLKVKVVITNNSTLTLPGYCTILQGSSTFSGTNGTYYFYFDCWEDTTSSEEVLVNVLKAQ